VVLKSSKRKLEIRYFVFVYEKLYNETCRNCSKKGGGDEGE
jgi:hypothetical protein